MACTGCEAKIPTYTEGGVSGLKPQALRAPAVGYSHTIVPTVGPQFAGAQGVDTYSARLEVDLGTAAGTCTGSPCAESASCEIALLVRLVVLVSVVGRERAVPTLLFDFTPPWGGSGVTLTASTAAIASRDGESDATVWRVEHTAAFTLGPGCGDAIEVAIADSAFAVNSGLSGAWTKTAGTTGDDATLNIHTECEPCCFDYKLTKSQGTASASAEPR